MAHLPNLSNLFLIVIFAFSLPTSSTITTRQSIDNPTASLCVQWKRAAAYAGDLMQHAPRRLITQTWAKYNVTSYSYHFNVFPAGLDATIGVTHFQEVAFMMHNVEGLGYENAVASNPFAGKPESYTQAATMMSRMWASFIVDGDPNNSGVGCVYWPAYTLDNPRNIVFDTNVTNLAYVEPDTYRAEGIAYIQDRIVSVYSR